MTLSTRANEILKIIEDFWIEHQYPPSMGDIGRELNKTIATVKHHMKVLEKEGFIVTDPGQRRTIRIVGMEVQIPRRAVLPAQPPDSEQPIDQSLGSPSEPLPEAEI